MPFLTLQYLLINIRIDNSRVIVNVRLPTPTQFAVVEQTLLVEGPGVVIPLLDSDNNLTLGTNRPHLPFISTMIMERTNGIRKGKVRYF